MITEFADDIQRDAHEQFQKWRRAHPAGFFINRKSGVTYLLHTSLCSHPGSTDWGSEAGHSLTRKRKICSTSIAELEAWAAERGISVRPCQHCAPPDASAPLPVEDQRRRLPPVGARLLNRNSPDSAAQVFEYLFPDALVRKQCLEAMAESIATAHSLAPQAWSITLFRHAVRLNVGKIEVMAFFADMVHCVLDSECIPVPVKEHQGVELYTKPGGVYRSVPVSAICEFPAEMVGEMFPVLRSSHESVVRVACRVKGTTWRGAYSPGVVQFLSTALGRQLFHPSYYQVQDKPGVPLEVTEGAPREATVNVYERNPYARNQCIQHYGCRCEVCGFDFKRFYGELGSGYIQVHHLKPLCEIREEYVVDPIADLRPICPNCHAMIHRRPEMLSIAELKGSIRNETAVG